MIFSNQKTSQEIDNHTCSINGFSQEEKQIKTNYTYGTAGFRLKAELMPRVAHRIGILTALLSKKRKQSLGIMITASHNPESDNGVKIIEPNGEMLQAEWEAYASSMVNLPESEMKALVGQIVEKEEISMKQDSLVFVGRDSRKSSLALANIAIQGCREIGANVVVVDYGLQTTPQLHFYVGSFNNEKKNALVLESEYFDKLCKAFCKFIKLCKRQETPISLIVDAANGVGACKLAKLQEHLGMDILQISIVNSNGPLNENCGADFVKMSQKPPIGLELQNGKRYCSVDGDVDRILYYYCDSSSSKANEGQDFHLLDGDKMAALFCVYLKKLISQAGIQCQLGAVQTAYSNGNCASFLRSIGIEPEFACTGVKCLHHAAKKYDIAVYFEANGHGTITTSANFQVQLEKANGIHAEKLKAFLSLVNPFVGDAIADMLLTEAILLDWNWSLQDWNELYRELPNLQTKLKVKDKNVFVCTDADRRLIQPLEIQKFIDESVGKFRNARCFVRPSGTEDLVRVYAEGESQEDCQSLANQICAFISERM